MKLIKFCVLAFLFISSTSAFSQSRHFGYFISSNVDAPGSILEIHQHTTFAWIGVESTSFILQEVATAQAQGIKAMVSVQHLLFEPASGLSGCPASFEPAATSQWNTFINELVDEDYLVPGNPGASTVHAFYVVDEPELCDLKDQGGSAHPALAHAVDVIKNHPDTSNFPIATIASSSYSQVINGLHLFDWVGMNQYDKSTGQYLSNFTGFSNSLLASQRTLLVPQAAEGGFMSSYGLSHDPDLIFDRFMSDSKIIGITPFLWRVNGTTGTRDLPILRAAYENYGGQIKTGNPISASVTCIPFSQNQHRCIAGASGGSTPYSYSWPAPCGGSSSVVFCDCNAPPGQSVQVNLTVTDSAGFYRKASGSMTCGINPQWDPDSDG